MAIFKIFCYFCNIPLKFVIFYEKKKIFFWKQGDVLFASFFDSEG